MTYAAICKHLNLSSPKTLELINSLAETGILEQNEKGSSIGGRKPILNKLKSHTFFVLCVEVELFKVKLTIVDNTNTFIRTASSSFLLTKDWSSRSEEHTSELQSLMRISYAVFCLKKKKQTKHIYI